MIGDLKFDLNSENFYIMRFLLGSFMRSRVLLALVDSSSRLNTLRNDLGKSSATVLHAVSELESYNLTIKDYKDYCLSSKGFIYALALDKLVKNLYIFQSNPNFWQKHDIDNLPNEFVENAYLLKDSTYISTDKRDMEKPVNDYFKNIKNSDNIRVILPVFSEIYLEMILKSLREDHKLELIVDDKVFGSLKNSSYFNRILRLSKEKKLVLKKYFGDLSLFLTIGNDFISLNLFDMEGFFDDSETIFNKTSDGVKWGEIIFNFYLDNSSTVVL